MLEEGEEEAESNEVVDLDKPKDTEGIPIGYRTVITELEGAKLEVEKISNLSMLTIRC
jgi:hypothetical protein